MKYDNVRYVEKFVEPGKDGSTGVVAVLNGWRDAGDEVFEWRSLAIGGRLAIVARVGHRVQKEPVAVEP